MGNYKIKLSTKGSNDIILNLKNKEDTNLIDDYYSLEKAATVYNNKYYDIAVLDELNNFVYDYKLFVNNESVARKEKRIFLDCFGYAQLEIAVNDEVLVSDNIAILISKTDNNQNIIKMIDYIFENCDDYLYEEHKFAKIHSSFKKNDRVSIDSKLSMANDIYIAYVKCFNQFKNALQKKLIYEDTIGDINKLQQVHSKTIQYIINHPEELQPIDCNSGIMVNKQYYEPRKTLIKNIAYSSDIYENRVIVGFIKSVILSLRDMKSNLKLRIENKDPLEVDGYIRSFYYIYTRNKKILNDYLLSIDRLIEKFQIVYNEYKHLFNVKEEVVFCQPRYTNIFRRIMPYNIIFGYISGWFNCGDYDITKSDLMLSFISTSKIYEYYCLLRIISSIKKNGFEELKFFSYKYIETKFYKNTTYNNTFEFTKNNLTLTLYYQPIIYGDIKGSQRPNKINLYRNTSISIQNPDALSILDEDTKANQGNYYLPDYLIKVDNKVEEKYYILDAKYSTLCNVERYQLPYLVYKYLFSISTLDPKDKLEGLGIVYGKDVLNRMDNVNDIAERLSKTTLFKTNTISLTGNESEENLNIDKYINSIINDS